MPYLYGLMERYLQRSYYQTCLQHGAGSQLLVEPICKLKRLSGDSNNVSAYIFFLRGPFDLLRGRQRLHMLYLPRASIGLCIRGSSAFLSEIKSRGFRCSCAGVTTGPFV